jgi:alkylated DNA repair dioxygenase AlkB
MKTTKARSNKTCCRESIERCIALYEVGEGTDCACGVNWYVASMNPKTGEAHIEERTAAKKVAIGYVPDFLSKEETTALFDACTSLKYVRKQERGGLARHATVAFSTAVDKHQTTSPLDSAPRAIRESAQRLSDHAGRDINYLAVVRYIDGTDYVDWHQHKSDKKFDDQTVWIVSTGAERPFAWKPVGGKLEKTMATAGSLIVLPSSFNTTHEHKVPKCKNCTTVRYAVNAKHLPAKKVTSAAVGK